MSLGGRVALVTGGSRGIGQAISVGLAQDGADVAVNYVRDEQAAHETADAIVRLGRRALVVKASVDNLHEVIEMVETVERELGPIGILVHSAGIASRGRSVVDTDPGEVSRVMGIHAIGAHHACRLALPKMRTLGRGDVILISSAATIGMAANGAPYNMAKAALEALAFTLSKEELPHGIRVNVVAPGLVDTEMGRRLVKGAMGVADIRTLDRGSPFGHVCTPEEVASIVRFLVSEGGSYVTGQRIYVHGGGQ
jgi:NAD(P)-dependent dehydrogenase (short-subunit alcohol dehydrogenase family)